MVGAAPRVSRLGHVGLFCFDLAAMRDFYSEVIGLNVTDEVPGRVAFLSSRPEDEHHEVALVAGRTAPRDVTLVQQVSFRCDELADVVGFHARLKEAGVRFDMVVSHGNAVGAYFFDPEGNRSEVYWDTGMKVRQPFLHALDLDRPVEDVRAEVIRIVEKYGATGYIDPELSAAQRAGAKTAS